MKSYLVVSLSHKNCDIGTREKLAFDVDTQKKILREFIKSPHISESILLSTCNRVEVIIKSKVSREALNFIFTLFENYSNVSKQELEGRADIYEEEGAVKHILGVASALESVVVGEAQIVGQLKDAYNMAKEENSCGRGLTNLIEYALKCAAKIKNVTDVGKNPVSVSSAAVVRAKEIMGGSLEGKDVLVFGTGEMAVIAAKHLVASEANVVMIGRDIEKTKNIAEGVDKKVKSATYMDLSKYLNSYELLFTATGAPHPLINNDIVEPQDFKRYWFDIAVPRDIGKIDDPNVSVFAVDDLKGIVEANIAMRNGEASKAYTIIGAMTEEFFDTLKIYNADPLIKDMRKKAELASSEEIERAIAKGYISKESKEVVTKLVHNAFKKFLHGPTVNIKSAMSSPEKEDVENAIKYLFQEVEGR
ncbi:MAG: glutamyl-tRNA reductase [Campylobacterales bacterium]|nr:glutamyl-tRNA reductase [Campylobacterales bacterium]